MNVLIVFLTIVFITVIGYSFIHLFKLLKNFDELLKISYSFGLGVSLICLQLYLYSRLNIIWNKELLILPWLILILTVLFKYRKIITFRHLKYPKTTLLENLMIVGIVISIFYVVFEALIRPATTWDSWATWLFQSKIFFVDGWINPKLFLQFHLYDPFFFNLLGTFMYIMLGKVDDTAVLLNSSAFYIFLSLLFFSYTKKEYGFRKALLFTFLLVTTQNLIRHGGRMEAGIADLPLGYYAFCSLTLFMNYFKTKNFKIFIVFTLFLGMTSLIKLEGIIISILLIIGALYAIYKNKLYKHLFALIFWLLPIIDWEIFKSSSGLKLQTLVISSFKVSWQITINTVLGILRELINIKSWNLVWITYFFSLFFGFKKILHNKELLLINFMIVFLIFSYFAIYIVFSKQYSPESSIERLLIQVVPMALLSMLVLFDKLPDKLNLNNIKIMKFIYNFFSRFY